MDLLLGLVIIVLLSIVLLFISQRFKVPSVVSFLLIGMVAGPYGLSVITNQSAIQTFGEIGIMLLLFTIGLEFSFEKLLKSWRIVVIGGIVQVCTTIAAITAITYLLGFPFNEAIFLGFLVSLSSTAIVMKILQERGEVETLHGRTMLGILIFQDLAIIPMILILPLLIGSDAPSQGDALPLHVAKVALILGIIVVSARWLIPEFLYRVARQKNRELFLFTVAGICFVTAWLTNSAGLSLTLGAFVAGLIVGESDYSIDALSNIIPFRDVFAAVFFISIGMLLDTSLFLEHFGIVITIIAVIILVKILTGAFTVAVLGKPLKVMVFTGLALAQIGEFSFVLASSGLNEGLIPRSTYQFFLAGAVVTMALTPFLMKGAPGVLDWLYRVRKGSVVQARTDEPGSEGEKAEPSDHIVIAGFGITGKSVARAAEIAGIPYTAIDLNPDVVRHERRGGRVHIVYGDAAHREVLEHAGLGNARALVIVISEQDAIPRIIHAARGISPSVAIIARTRFLASVDDLLNAGADEVIPEEFASSVEIFGRILTRFTVPEDEISKFLRDIRGRGYRAFTRVAAFERSIIDSELELSDARIHSFRVKKDAPIIGRTSRDLDFRNKYSVDLVGLRREGTTIALPDEGLTFEEGDVLILLGSDEHVGKVVALCDPLSG